MLTVELFQSEERNQYVANPQAAATVNSHGAAPPQSTADPIHVHDLQATILHCLGIDHKRQTYRFQGRDDRLTDVSGSVIDRLLA